MGKSAKRFLTAGLAVLLVLVAVNSGYAVQVPWKTFSESAEYVTGSDMGVCPSGAEVARVRLEKNGDAYMLWYAADTNNIMLLYYKGNVDGAMPTEVGLGKVDPAHHDDYPTFKWYSFDEIKGKIATPCDFLAPIKT